MNDSDLEQAITDRLRAKIEAERLNSTDFTDPSSGGTSWQKPAEKASDFSMDLHSASNGTAIASTEALVSEILGEELARRFRDLQANFDSLKIGLQEHLASLSKEGVPPSFRLQNDMAAGHRNFLKLRRDVAAKLQPNGSTPVKTDSIAGLVDLAEWVVKTSRNGSQIHTPKNDPPKAEIAPPVEIAPPGPVQPSPVLPEPVAETVEAPPSPVDSPPSAPDEVSPDLNEETTTDESIASRAEEMMNRILDLRLKPGKEVPEFDEALERVRVLKRMLNSDSEMNGNQEVIDLVEGTHPLAALVTMVEKTGKLNDYEWAELHGKIIEGLGRSVGMAAARDRFTLET